MIKNFALRLLLSIALNENFEIHHIDISNAFLNGLIEEEINIDPPEGLKDKFKER
jgi:hypothetical protein